MPRKPKYRKPYPPEFRREAVALYARTDRTLGEIAGDLGVSRESLRLWVQQAQIERGERDAGEPNLTHARPGLGAGHDSAVDVLLLDAHESPCAVEVAALERTPFLGSQPGRSAERGEIAVEG
jgi:transposase-like protein